MSKQTYRDVMYRGGIPRYIWKRKYFWNNKLCTQTYVWKGVLSVEEGVFGSLPSKYGYPEAISSK